MNDWHPIETGPKDTSVLVYCKHGPCEVGHYNTLMRGWVTSWDHRYLDTPTHWMPLPHPPVSTSMLEGLQQG